MLTKSSSSWAKNTYVAPLGPITTVGMKLRGHLSHVFAGGPVVSHFCSFVHSFSSLSLSHSLSPRLSIRLHVLCILTPIVTLNTPTFWTFNPPKTKKNKKTSPLRHSSPLSPIKQMLLTQEGGHLQGLQPCRADEAHQVDGIIAHTARDHQKGLGFVGPCFFWRKANIFGSQIENGEGTFLARASRKGLPTKRSSGQVKEHGKWKNPSVVDGLLYLLDMMKFRCRSSWYMVT